VLHTGRDLKLLVFETLYETLSCRCCTLGIVARAGGSSPPDISQKVYEALSYWRMRPKATRGLFSTRYIAKRLKLLVYGALSY
jgi:hypothetical protein